MELLVLGLSHKTAPVEVRERFALPESALPETASRARLVGCAESFVVSTCNRVEVYAACEDPSRMDVALTDVLATLGNAGVSVLRPHLYSLRGRHAVRHLFRVAASLDSLVVGEPQILGQLKSAFEVCREAGLTGPALNRACERAFAVAKRVRTETGIGKSSVSVASVAVDLAKQIFGRLDGRTAVLVGAGKMGELSARHLIDAGVGELLVANRSLDRAQQLAARLGGHPRQLDELPVILERADVVITSTGARRHLIEPKLMKKVLRARKYRPIFLVDIAVPRDVDPRVNDLDNVYVYDVDDLSEIANGNLEVRKREAQVAEALVDAEAERFLRELAAYSVKPTIVELRRKAELIKATELERLNGRLRELDPKHLKAVEMLADGIVNKLLHDVMIELKRSATGPDAEQAVAAARRLFALDLGSLDDGENPPR